MILGVTGSRKPMHESFCERLFNFIQDKGVTELHHGDCTGWDHQAFMVADWLCIKTVAHPPENDAFRAETKSTVVLPPKPYLERNKDIVNASDYIIAVPDGPEHLRSGTWSTVRYAKKVGKRGVIWK